MGARTLQDTQSFLAALYQLSTRVDFLDEILPLLHSVMPTARLVYEEIAVPTLAVATKWWPDNPALRSRLTRLLKRYIHEHPILRHIHHEPIRAISLDHVIPPGQWRQTELYKQYFRPLGIAHLITVPLESTCETVRSVSFNRRTRFTERERELLNLLQPHLHHAFQTYHDASEQRQRLTLMSEMEAAEQCGAFAVGHYGKILSATTNAERLLNLYWPAHSSRDTLPTDFQECLDTSRQKPLSNDRRRPRRYSIRRATDTFLVTIAASGRQTFLRLEKKREETTLEQIRSLGIPPRGSEVLYWLSRGKTNAEIGLILHLSPRTVQKHLERLFPRLGVSTRTGALQRLRQLLA